MKLCICVCLFTVLSYDTAFYPPSIHCLDSMAGAKSSSPGQQETPVGDEVKVLAAQAAPRQSAQASDHGYGTGTGTSSRNKLVTGMC